MTTIWCVCEVNRVFSSGGSVQDGLISLKQVIPSLHPSRPTLLSFLLIDNSQAIEDQLSNKEQDGRRSKRCQWHR